MSILFIFSLIYYSENLKLPVCFNNIELASEEFHLFITGSINRTIFQFLRKGFNIFFGPIYFSDQRTIVFLYHVFILYWSHWVALIRADYGFGTSHLHPTIICRMNLIQDQLRIRFRNRHWMRSSYWMLNYCCSYSPHTRCRQSTRSYSQSSSHCNSIDRCYYYCRYSFSKTCFS